MTLQGKGALSLQCEMIGGLNIKDSKLVYSMSFRMDNQQTYRVTFLCQLGERYSCIQYYFLSLGQTYYDIGSIPSISLTICLNWMKRLWFPRPYGSLHELSTILSQAPAIFIGHYSQLDLSCSRLFCLYCVIKLQVFDFKWVFEILNLVD